METVVVAADVAAKRRKIFRLPGGENGNEREGRGTYLISHASTCVCDIFVFA